MSQQKEILASISLGGPNFRANYRGLLGYWCQADAVFIETVQPEAGEAIAKYRQKLVAGDIGVSHNQHTDSLSRLALLSQLAAAEAQATELLARATRAEAKAAGLLVELGDQEAEKLALVLELQAHKPAPELVDTVTDVSGCIGWVERFTAGEGITKFFGRNLQRTATGPARLSFVEAAHDVRQWFKDQPVSYQQEAVVPLLPRNMSVAAYEAQKELTAS